ncbi:ArnT family glycosyltransferase [Altericroceibacterium endophyticum]|uniref:Glycosyl transferase n=1 Tax=Altericroceibacterium endophyticum TaxID=1808508 RepID=A0A6I4T6Q8_9SPHN|nr:glycosyltransferase family 39 protein [Altericroceibacterium endophyticum]MXO65791.1 glycosyl transferase [Altericroceibacterium endophyticum]
MIVRPRQVGARGAHRAFDDVLSRSSAFAEGQQWLCFIWGLYIGLRILALIPEVALTPDADWYYDQAISLAQGRGYMNGEGEPSAFWPPGWPLTLSVIFRVFGASPLVVGLFNLAASLVIGLMMLKLGRLLSGNELAARTGLLLLAVYPNAIAYVPLALTEVYYTALLMLGCWILLSRTHWRSLLLAGVIFGVATLVKAQTIVVIPAIFAIDWLRAAPFWRRFPALFGQGALVLLVALLTIAPWTIRNYQQLGEFVPVSTNGGITLLTGNHDFATGDYSPDAPVVREVQNRPGLSEVERDAEAGRIAKEWIADNPQRFLSLSARKILRLWLPDGEGEWAYQSGAPSYYEYQRLYRTLRYANQAYYALLMIGFLAAFMMRTELRLRVGQRWAGWWLLPYMLALYLTLICVVFSGQSRFHYPIMPFICLTCGWLLTLHLSSARNPAMQRL